MTTAEQPARAAVGMHWSGWGTPAQQPELPTHGRVFLRKEMGFADRPRTPVSLDDVKVKDSALDTAALEGLAAIVGGEHVLTGRLDRILRAGGKSYPDLLRRRTGDAEDAPDAIVLPGSHDEVAAVLRWCVEHEVAVVPFGGGTSVVGGVEPLRGRFAALVSLDLRRLDQLLSVDPLSLTAVLQPGLRGPQAEALLNEHGLTLGHFPQSYEHASIGGYVATRSAGQASTGYGRIDDLVQGLRMATPTGDVVVGVGSATAAGPDLRHLLVGSEGTLGVITEVTLRVHRKPAVTRYEGWFFRSFEDGATALRRLVQAGVAPDVTRLSDEHETRSSMALSGSKGAKALAGKGYLSLRGYTGGCLAIFGWEGEDLDVRRRRAASAAVARAAGGLPLGQGIGRHWAEQRYSGPYLRDTLLDHGVFVETLETATSWTKLHELHRAVRRALWESLSGRGTPPLVLCHISHVYPTGASLYFTFLAQSQVGEELEQWKAAKTAACEALVAQGATITHHHAVGTDHRPYLTAEVGAQGVEILRAVKDRLDPTGVLNPGKLIP